MNNHAYENEKRLLSVYKHQHPNRKGSIATTATRSTTTSKKPMLNTENSISPTNSTSRRPSTPLSIAERFMSPSYNADNTTSTLENDKTLDIIEEGRFNTVSSCGVVTPDSKSTRDRLSLSSPLTFFLSPDPSQQYEPYQSFYQNSRHPLDTYYKTACSCAHQSICSSKTHEDITQTKRKKKRRTNHKPKSTFTGKHMHSIPKLAVVEEDPQVMEKTKKSNATGIWIGRCCFIRCGKISDKTLPPPILKNRRKKSEGHACCCCGRRTWVISSFLCVITVVIMVFLFYPRIPLIRIEGAINTIPTKVTQTQQGGRTSNVAFESTWLLNVTMDNRRNYITTRLNRVQVIAKDALTGLLIGKGLNNDGENGSSNSGSTVIYLPRRAISTIQLSISVNYQARDSSDTTFSNLLRACVVSNGSNKGNQDRTVIDNHNSSNNSNRVPVPIFEPASHHSPSIHFWFTLYIFGLDWVGYKPTVIATPATGGFFCPSSPS